MTTVHPPPSVDGGVRLSQRRPTPSGWGTVALLAVLTVWAAVVAAIAAADGFIADGGGLPWLVIAAVAAPLAMFFVAFRRRPVRDHLLAIDPRLVLSIQLWRVIGIAFLFGWALGDLDSGFAVPAGVGDVTVGAAAFVALAMLLNGTLSRPRVIGLTVLGIGDFVVAVVVGGVIVQPDNLEVLPWVLFPTLAVPFFAIAHVVTWTQLVTQPEPARTFDQRPQAGRAHNHPPGQTTEPAR